MLFQDELPPFPLSGMLNKSGGKVRLTFKLELDQVWIGTKERTDKIPMNSIKSIVSEPIEGFEQYHVMVSLGKIYYCLSRSGKKQPSQTIFFPFAEEKPFQSL